MVGNVRGLVTRFVFATAAAATLAASMGMAAPPHRVPPGTPLIHTLVLGAYRYAFLVDPQVDTTLLADMVALHRTLALVGIPMPEMPGMGASANSDELPTFQTSSGVHPVHDLAVTLALLAFLVPRLSRPTRMALARLDQLGVARPQWRPALPLSPPRFLRAA